MHIFALQLQLCRFLSHFPQNKMCNRNSSASKCTRNYPLRIIAVSRDAVTLVTDPHVNCSISDSGATVNGSLSSGAPSESNYISAANNITISCVAVGILCTAVIIGIMVRRKLRNCFATYLTVALMQCGRKAHTHTNTGHSFKLFRDNSAT